MNVHKSFIWPNNNYLLQKSLLTMTLSSPPTSLLMHPIMGLEQLVISHVFPDGSENLLLMHHGHCPLVKGISTGREGALSLVFGAKIFHQYLYGRKLNLITDNKPLTAIFGSKKGIPSLAAGQLQRWAVLLSTYTYDIQYKPTQLHCNADGLPRPPLSLVDDVALIIVQCWTTAFPTITSQYIQRATQTDKVLSRVCGYVKDG